MADKDIIQIVVVLFLINFMFMYTTGFFDMDYGFGVDMRSTTDQLMNGIRGKSGIEKAMEVTCGNYNDTNVPNNTTTVEGRACLLGESYIECCIKALEGGTSDFEFDSPMERAINIVTGTGKMLWMIAGSFFIPTVITWNIYKQLIPLQIPMIGELILIFGIILNTILFYHLYRFASGRKGTSD